MINKTFFSQLFKQPLLWQRLLGRKQRSSTPKFVTKNVYTSVKAEPLRDFYTFTRYMDATIRWFVVSLIWLVGLLVLRLILNSFVDKDPTLASLILVSQAQAQEQAQSLELFSAPSWLPQGSQSLEQSAILATSSQLNPTKANTWLRSELSDPHDMLEQSQAKMQAQSQALKPQGSQSPIANAAIPATSSHLRLNNSVLDFPMHQQMSDIDLDAEPTSTSASAALSASAASPAQASVTEASKEQAAYMSQNQSQRSLPAAQASSQTQAQIFAASSSRIASKSEVAQTSAVHLAPAAFELPVNSQVTRSKINSSNKSFGSAKTTAKDLPVSAFDMARGSKTDLGAASSAPTSVNVAAHSNSDASLQSADPSQVNAHADAKAQVLAKSSTQTAPTYTLKDRPDATFMRPMSSPWLAGPDAQGAHKLPNQAYDQPPQQLINSLERQSRLNQAMAEASRSALLNQQSGSAATTTTTTTTNAAAPSFEDVDVSTYKAHPGRQAQAAHQFVASQPSAVSGASSIRQSNRNSNQGSASKIIYQPKVITMEPLPNQPVDLATLKREAQKRAQQSAAQSNLAYASAAAGGGAVSEAGVEVIENGLSNQGGGIAAGVDQSVVYRSNVTLDGETDFSSLSNDTSEIDYSMDDLVMRSLFTIVLIWRLLALYCIYHGGQGVVINFKKRMITIYHDWLVENILMTNVESIDVVEPAENTLSRRHLQQLLPHVNSEGIQITYVAANAEDENTPTSEQGLQLHTTLIKGYSQTQLQKMFDVLNQIY